MEEDAVTRKDRFSNFITSDETVIKGLRTIVKRPGRGEILLINGGVAAGKTIFADALYKELEEKGVPSLYMTKVDYN